MELAWWIPVAVPAVLMIAALALQQLENALLGSHDPSEARRPPPLDPAISAAADTPLQRPVTRALPAEIGSAAASGPIMTGTELGPGLWTRASPPTATNGSKVTILNRARPC